MDLLHLVDRLEEIVASAQKVPIGSRVIIDRRRLFDIVDQMRVVIPQDLREAQELVARRDELRREAEEEARMIVARAEEQAVRLVDEHEVTAAARGRAEEVEAQARDRLEERIGEANASIQERLADSRRLAEQQRSDADEYARELLRRLERQLEAFVGSVRAGLTQLDVEEVVPGPAGESGLPAQAREVSATEDVAEVAAREPVPAGAVAEASAVAASAGPVPLHRPQPPAADDDPTELENLLARPPRPAPPTAGEVSAGETAADGDDVIDDFALPRLDDDPTHGEPDSEEKPGV